jgi:glutathione S-transferase
MKLYVLPPSPRAIKVLATKNHLKIECEVHPLNYFGAEQLGPEFAKLNPNKRQPVLQDGEWVLWESNAILFHLALLKPDGRLWPEGARDRADVMRWLFWESSHWDPAWDILLTERLKKQYFVTEQSGRRTQGKTVEPQAPNAERVAEGEQYVRELAAILNTHLSHRDWLVGKAPSIADLALAAWIPGAPLVGVALTEHYAISRWYEKVETLSGWRDSLPQRTPT